MYGPLKLIHHSHTGKRRPHEHTSYLTLAIMLLLVGAVLARLTFSASADTPYTTPGVGSIGLTGIMPAPPPTTAPTITSPINGQHFTSSPITVSGTCPPNDLVEIFKNDIFAGSTPCESNSTFSVQIGPMFGKNSLTAQVYDALNQAGPMSKAVIIYYDYSVSPAAPTSLLDLSGTQLILETNAVYRGSFPKQAMNVPITVIGGTPPFAINVQWGDTTNTVIPRSSNSSFNASHAYSAPGTYKIILQGTDSKGLAAFLTVAAIINGQPAGVTTSVNNTKPLNKYFVLWPVFAIAATAVVCFWVGERREKKIMQKMHPSATPTFGTAPPPPPPAPAAHA